MSRSDIRLALPSKGRLESEALQFLSAAGLPVEKPNPRQYLAHIHALPGVSVLFQRAGDIVVSVRDGSVDIGLTGLDAVQERAGDLDHGPVVILHEALGFGHCSLALAVPESWAGVERMTDLRARSAEFLAAGQRLRVATKYPELAGRFLRQHGLPDFSLITAEGTLEAAPAIGYADVIADLVSTGTTLRDNRLRPLSDGTIIRSQACLVANREALRTRPEVLAVARELLEYVEAHLRALEYYLVFANMRGESPAEIARGMFAHPDLGGLQGPTLSPVIVRDGSPGWHAVNIIVRQDRLMRAVNALRDVGGSGVVVSPVTYIFEKEPERYRRLLSEMLDAEQGEDWDSGANP